MSDPAEENTYPLPEVNVFNRPFWEAARKEQFKLQRCTECESEIYPPRAACPDCFADLEWFIAEGTGEVFTYGIVHRPSKPAVFEEKLPLVSCVVELVEGPKVLANLLGVDSEDVEVGMEVVISFEAVSEDITLPQFKPASD